MMDFDPSSVAPPPSLERIAAFETYYDVKLPVTFIDFIGRWNGAKVTNGEIRTPGAAQSIERFLPLLEDISDNSDHAWADITVVIAQIEDRISTDDDDAGLDLIPIAALSAGDFLCLDYTAGHEKKPRIVRWDHEASDDGAPVTTPVAETFEALLSL